MDVAEVRQRTMEMLGISDPEDVAYIDEALLVADESARDVNDATGDEAFAPVETIAAPARIVYYYGHRIVWGRGFVTFSNGSPNRPNDPCGNRNRWRLILTPGDEFDPFRQCGPRDLSYRITHHI